MLRRLCYVMVTMFLTGTLFSHVDGVDFLNNPGPNRALGCTVFTSNDVDDLEPLNSEPEGPENADHLVDGCMARTGSDSTTCCYSGSRLVLLQLHAMIKVTHIRLHGEKCDLDNQTDSCAQPFDLAVLLTNFANSNEIDYTTNNQSVILSENSLENGTFDIHYPQPMSSQAVVLFNTNMTSWELCEVEVFGDCPEFHFGDTCQHRCHCNRDLPCDQRTGVCDLGCIPGWMYANCSQPCTPGAYGTNCLQDCSYCLNAACFNVNGSCLYGCDRGVTGDRCDKVCSPGTYGNNCRGRCGQCASLCGVLYGTCKPPKCLPGWAGSRCSRPCKNYTYGDKCEQTCGKCKAGQVCDFETGICPAGCEPGWFGVYCQTECQSGTFGSDCSSICTGCIGQACDRVTGMCKLKACSPGWHGNKCQHRCQRGRYGTNCSATCGACLKETCDVVTGTCLHGCRPDFSGDKCNLQPESLQWYVYASPPVGLFLVILLIVICTIRHQRRTQHQIQSTKYDRTGSQTKI